MATLKIFKGDDTGGTFGHVIQFTLTVAPGTPTEGCRAEFEFDGIVKTFSAPIVSGETREIVYTHDETASMALGTRTAIFRLIDAQGRIRTLDNTVYVCVTDIVSEVYPGSSSATVVIGTGITWEQISGKPLEGLTMVANPTQRELTNELKTIWTALGGTVACVMLALTCGALTRTNEWQDVPPVTTIGTVLDLGVTSLAPATNYTDAAVAAVSNATWIALGGKASTIHAATHAVGGSDEVTVAQSQVTGLCDALSAKRDKTDFAAVKYTPPVANIQGAVFVGWISAEREEDPDLYIVDFTLNGTNWYFYNDPPSPGWTSVSSSVAYDREMEEEWTYGTITFTRQTASGNLLVGGLTGGVANDPDVALLLATRATTNDVTAATNGLASRTALDSLSIQVSSIGAHLNAEDARFVSTNYDSVVRVPEAFVEIKVSNTWLTVWKEMNRWNRWTGTNFTWDAWCGFDCWKTNVETQLSWKADRAWGAYDSETGGYSPEGYTQISSSNILIAAGMAYQRTVTSAGSVWILRCNSGSYRLSGSTNGYFQVVDSKGNVNFEIVNGEQEELGANADGITVDNSTTPPTVIVPYSVEAPEHPTIQICDNLSTAKWKPETDADCLANVTWTGTSGDYVARVQRKTSGAGIFVTATYLGGSMTYIRNAAPVSMDSILLNGTRYYLGTATVGGHTVLTLSTTRP